MCDASCRWPLFTGTSEGKMCHLAKLLLQEFIGKCMPSKTGSSKCMGCNLQPWLATTQAGSGLEKAGLPDSGQLLWLASWLSCWAVLSCLGTLGGGEGGGVLPMLALTMQHYNENGAYTM